ncbi:hypothetical protein B0F90DRAFT_205174 [Multifurca ochricompacta]|uniref:BTB domain-containing protein n=1 Tax=Multifurca ochricompacta TaxID=376703 RepID=A0AAD4QMX1_9AGAM|nr:hypothetical protein B0F90DRAFT_205174 [Multifurca ochricompacta]
MLYIVLPTSTIERASLLSSRALAHTISFFLSFMAPHIVSWRSDEYNVSPILSSTPSIVSVDSLFPEIYANSSSVPETPHPPDPRTKIMNSSGIQSGRSKTPASMSPTGDDTFLRHGKYFFKDGNITFLVDGTLYCVHRYFFSRDSIFSPLDLHSLVSTTMKPCPPSYH